ncbi:hypothetical protein B0T14DRAFT_531539 [Immersiella caudata]|uniref:Uncharacterized protein n=1 Tax=Immersiella caudata TaxID=314043 RepID=A0AA39U5A2_9PEZI|nr:hypothetical protein B0T14DRAFT_531539 [Immersiella caudata]
MPIEQPGGPRLTWSSLAGFCLATRPCSWCGSALRWRLKECPELPSPVLCRLMQPLQTPYSTASLFAPQ